MFFERTLYKSNYIIFISSWCGTHTKIRSKLVDIVTAGSQKITLCGPQRTSLGILRVKVRSCYHLAQTPSGRTTRSIYSQLPFILEAVPPSATWGGPMPWWQGPTYRRMASIFGINVCSISLLKKQHLKSQSYVTPLHRSPKQHSNKFRWKIYRTNMKSHPKSSLYSGFKIQW